MELVRGLFPFDRYGLMGLEARAHVDAYGDEAVWFMDNTAISSLRRDFEEFFTSVIRTHKPLDRRSGRE